MQGHWSRKRYIVTGLILIAAGVWQGYEGVESFRGGVPVKTLNYVEVEWWEQLGASVLVVLFGMLVAGCGFGWIKPRGEQL